MPTKKLSLKIKDKSIPYSLKRRKGMRSMRLSINSQGSFVVSAPKWYPLYLINKFIQEKSDWIWEKIKHIDFDLVSEKQKAEKDFYKNNKILAKKIIAEKVAILNRDYGFFYNKISIKNQKTCWGSCSQRRNLNFNVKIIRLPDDLQNYIIVHELCHLEELNHSRKFWNLVAKAIPDFQELRKKLKKQK